MKCWCMIGVDLVGPLKENDRFCYIITAVDYTSKWVELSQFMIKVHCLLLRFSPNSCEGSYIMYIDDRNLMTEIFMHELHVSNNFRYGACYINITDQERYLNNQIYSEFYWLTGTQHRITTAYHPQSNGLVERSHRTIDDMNHKQVTPPDVSWLEILDSVLFAIRVSRHCSTKTSPFEILYEHEPKLPFEMDYEIKKDNPVAPSVQAVEEQWERN